MIRIFKSILITVAMIAIVAATHAAEIHLAWDAPEGAQPIGYRIYGAANGGVYDFTEPLYEGSALSCTITVPDNAEYKFVAKAYLVGESAIYESTESNEVRHAVVVWTNPNLRVQ